MRYPNHIESEEQWLAMEYAKAEAQAADEAEAAAEHDRQEAEAEAEDAAAEANCRSCGAGIGEGERYCQDCADDHADSERDRLRDFREGKQ